MQGGTQDSSCQTDEMEIRKRNAVVEGLPGYLSRDVLKADSLLSCQICLQKYNMKERAPLSIPCGHSLCRSCASGLIQSGKRKCPFDNKPFECRNVDSLSKNFSLLDLLEAEKANIQRPDVRFCDQHQKKKTKFFCKSHTAFVCSECLLAAHLGHEIIPARPLILGQNVAKEVMNTKEQVTKIKEQADALLKTMEESYLREKELIEAAKKKLIEEAESLAASYQEDNEKEIERIRVAHRNLIAGIEEEEKALSVIDSALQEKAGEATDADYQETVRLNEWAKKEDQHLATRKRLEPQRIKNHKQFLD